MQDGDSIFRQPLGEVLRREISADFLKKELTIPEFLKNDIPLGILDKEIHFRRRPEEPPDDSAAVEQTR